MPIASLASLKKDEEEKDGGTDSYAGGAKSGIAIHNPGDADKAGASEPAGSSSPAAEASSSSATGGYKPLAPVAPIVGAAQADVGAGPTVDAAKPKGRVQIRFHDGSRKATEFNEDHTVGDLRAFCAACAGVASMIIMGGFPPKEVTDDSQSLKDAGLINAAVTVRPK
eukprot:TRINITY_DN14301_c0_g1_i1.p1 TRINITY_DN14301_c0_g1~~TRINITY_DN14301_c0_g1_i1.p1  ORF type:complete len:168 (+),score=39.54 TRINITY_DN14301_c0_g1_i1:98-601(+)